jgi:hypothetical protein
VCVFVRVVLKATSVDYFDGGIFCVRRMSATGRNRTTEISMKMKVG